MRKMSKISNYLLFIVLIVSIIPVLPVQSNGSEKFMVLEKVDLYLDGSITPVLVNITEPFDYVMRFVWNLVWTDNVVDFSVFGTLGVALTNGTEVIYNGTALSDSVTAIKDFGVFSYDVRIDRDDKNPKDNHLYSRLSFWKFIDPQKGLNVHDFTLQFRINDNITAACSDFFVIIEGYRLIVPEVAAKQFPLNPFDYFNRWALWAMTQPIVWLVTILGFAIIFYMFRKMR